VFEENPKLSFIEDFSFQVLYSDLLLV